MINHKIAEPSIQTVTGYFITNLSFILPMNEFLKSVNIWQNDDDRLTAFDPGQPG